MLPKREEIIALLQSMHKQSTLGQVADAILAKFESARAFSEIVKDMEDWPEDEEGKKICPLCGQTCYWQKLTFKKRYVEAMKYIRQAKRGLTFKEVTQCANSFISSDSDKPAFKETYFRYFTEARHWGFLVATGKILDRAEAYNLTPLGIEFLDGKVPADSFLLKLKGKEQVKRDGDADPIFMEQVQEDDPDELNDGAMHFDNAKPAL